MQIKSLDNVSFEYITGYFSISVFVIFQFSTLFALSSSQHQINIHDFTISLETVVSL